MLQRLFDPWEGADRLNWPKLIGTNVILRFWFLWLSLAFMDAALTQYVIAHGGLEANWILSRFPDVWLALKLAFTVLLGVLIENHSRLRVIGCATMLAVVLFNMVSAVVV